MTHLVSLVLCGPVPPVVCACGNAIWSTTGRRVCPICILGPYPEPRPPPPQPDSAHEAALSLGATRAFNPVILSEFLKGLPA